MFLSVSKAIVLEVWGIPQVKVTMTGNSIVLGSVLGIPLSGHVQSSHKGTREAKQLTSVTQPVHSRTGFLPKPGHLDVGFLLSLH